MELLPTPSRRTFIVRALETLRRQRGDASFVKGRIFEPGDRDFPDRWEASEAGVAALTRRILRHADLAWLDADVAGFRRAGGGRDLAVGNRVASYQHEGVAAWYAGIDDETSRCLFGVDLDGLDEGASVVGTMCHEVAHAYRDVHDVAVDDRTTEEHLTDLTTVFLGFGVLTTNASYTYRSEGIAGASMRGHRWSHQKRGYLSPAEMAYALAYQIGLRGGREAAHVASLLEPTQRDCFEAALEELGVREAPARRMPWWVPFVLLLLVPALAFAALVARHR
jgi:hypothetical protein